METLTIISFITTAISFIVTAASLVYAVMANREKARVERLIRAELRSLAGDVEQISHSPGWANKHFQAIQECALKLERNQDVNEILRHVQYGVGDSVAAERVIRNLLNQILALQEGMFGTRIIVHADKAEQDQKDKTS